MTEDRINVDLPDNQVSVWATPREFLGEGRLVSLLNFERLTKEEAGAYYADNEGKTYRLSFYDIAFGKERRLEIHARNFKDDLVHALRREVGQSGFLPGEKFVLMTWTEEKTTRFGVRKVHRWDLKKVVGEPEINL